MKRFGVFDGEGRLLRVGTCHNDTIEQQAGPGETAREGLFFFDRQPREDGYRMKRAREYPPIGDQLDAVVKMAAALKAGGTDLPPEMVALIDKVSEVKARHPKG